MHQAAQSERPVVVVATDTDIFVLMIYAFNKLSPTEKWFMKIGKDRYVDVDEICNLYGEQICEVLPGYHSLTGCDTTSFPFKVGKVKPWKKMMSQMKSSLLLSLGQQHLTQHDLDIILLFMQTVMYPGRQSEDFVETRIRMYEQQRTKSSLPLLPDRSSAVEHVKRSHLQTNIWKQCMNKDIDYPNPENYGWKVEDNSLVPVWFQCSQLPPSLIRRKRQRKKKSDNADSSNFADNESDTPRPSEPPRKRQRQQCAKPSTVCDSSAVEESSDSESSWSSDIMLNDSFTDTGSDSSDDSV